MAFVLCLDTVGRGDSLHLHVSKPPREGTLQHAFLRELEMVSTPQGPGTQAHFTDGRLEDWGPGWDIGRRFREGLGTLQAQGVLSAEWWGRGQGLQAPGRP